MKILVLSFYFTPDLCAGAFRADALVQALVQRFPEAQIEVVSTLPNRYQSFSSEAPLFEEYHYPGRVTVAPQRHD